MIHPKLVQKLPIDLIAYEKRTFFEFSLCLSRACLGKRIVFIYIWLKKHAFLTGSRFVKVRVAHSRARGATEEMINRRKVSRLGDFIGVKFGAVLRLDPNRPQLDRAHQLVRE